MLTKNVTCTRMYAAALFKNSKSMGCPGGLAVKNPPANAGDMGSVPGPGRFHVPWSNEEQPLQREKVCKLQPRPSAAKTKQNIFFLTSKNGGGET